MFTVKRLKLVFLKILDTDPRWHERGIKDVIHIAVMHITAKKLHPIKDLGSNPLLNAYKKLIESYDRGSTS